MISYSLAINEDRKEISNLLTLATLPTDDIKINRHHFIVAKTENIVVGCIGLEGYSNIGILRSFAVDERYRNQKIGKNLISQLTNYALQKGITKLYLLTTTASKYFSREGFEVIDRNIVPELIQKTSEFKYLCPSEAICMYKTIAL
ncbi:GCN5-related N-acetyltransferase family protein [Sporocytophaga myxococcoides]|uniref:GCN5-related N-acetyltransferase family protein n=1 Tax=Sporocytophaga myxococcoides TaxID=153721 RepID=A0A098LI25_9BACT|nr:arsenic resistance N-acetyltransferase ArsN2 [Sporocytophaga myxococcoides]GAL86114.1 GCN5-related N-acetyltransferase family protein [Sporocytophaga myxococcoides]